MRVPLRVMAVVVVIAILCSVSGRAEQGLADAARRRVYDQVLDLYVRDGLVYYRALKSDRRGLDSYVSSLAAASIESAPRDDQLVFWLNAYNALVLRTVIDHYPIAQRSSEYPPKSIRQIPGAFERLPHRVAGRTLTLDQIEQSILPGFNDPRVYLALGRGSMDGGRLRSEAFIPARLEAQLAEVASECLTRSQCMAIDRGNNKIAVSPVFSWREKEFVAAYAGSAPAAMASRSPIERAVIAFIQPKLLSIERDFLDKNQFQVVYQPYDWALNDLTGRGGR